MKSVLVIAPHPDDETLGCGGTLLRHRSMGDQVHWLIMTTMANESEFSNEIKRKRETEIKLVASSYSFQTVNCAGFSPAGLDRVPVKDIVSRIAEVIANVSPEIVYIPHSGDIHTDHIITHQATLSCCKVFRYPFIKKILAYETISETDVGTSLGMRMFTPNVFINIEKHLEDKIIISNYYASEMGQYPFPRCETGIRAYAEIRGISAGCKAAEAFSLIREIT